MFAQILLLFPLLVSFFAVEPSVNGQELHSRDTRKRSGRNGTSRKLRDRRRQGTPDCPDELTSSVSLTKTLTFYYAVVHAPDPSLSILCGRLESESEAWLGFGISQDESMVGSIAIIGRPDEGGEGTVKKYHLKGKSTYLIKQMHMQQQTLMDESIVQEDGRTTMRFTKYLQETGEGEVDINGDTVFLYAESVQNTFQFHGNQDHRGFFRLDLGVSSPE